MSNKLANWIPILELPDIGEMICGAAGTEWVAGDDAAEPDARYYESDDELPRYVEAALAFGALAVLMQDPPGGYSRIEIMRLADGDVAIEASEWGQAGWRIAVSDTLPAAVLAAAREVWLNA